MNTLIQSIIDDDARILQGIKDDDPERLAELICSHDRIFVAAAGRSLLMMKAFAMRLMHLGKTVHVVGDVTTPAIREGDLLIIGSGSGETRTLKVIAERASQLHADIALITTNPESAIALKSHAVFLIPASVNHLSANGRSWQPAGNSFEQCLLLLTDGVAIICAGKLGIDIMGSLSMHANLE